jgi:transcription initiation factor IIF auxiliary subunit
MEGGWGEFYNVALLVHFMMQTRIITISLVLKFKKQHYKTHPIPLP